MKPSKDFSSTRMLFDLCGTLYRSNTTYDFLSYFFRKRGGYKANLFWLFNSIFFKVIWKTLSLLGQRKRIRALFISFFKGMKVNEVAESIPGFISDYLEDRKILAIHKLLEEAKEEQAEIILVSASVLPVVSGIADHLGIDVYFGSELEVVDGTYSGKLLKDLEGEKVGCIGRMLKPANRTVVISDGPEDLGLMKVANTAYVVGSKWPEHRWSEALPASVKLKFISS